ESEGHSRPLNHRKSDSYAAAAAQRRSAGAGISDPEGGGPPPGCRSQAFPLRPPRRDGDPDRLPPWPARQRTLRVDLENMIELDSGRIHVRRAKNGVDSTHPLTGKEIRALRQLRGRTCKAASSSTQNAAAQ